MEKIDTRLNNAVRTYPSAQMKVIVETPEDPKFVQSPVERKGGRFPEQRIDGEVFRELL
jgi:hypothetical protein